MTIYLPKQYELKQLQEKAMDTVPNFDKKVFYRILYLIQDANFRFNYMDYLPAIHSRKFKNISSNYRAYLTFFENQNLIKRNDYYIVGEQSYLYEFTSNYTQTPFYSHIIDVSIPLFNDNDFKESIYNINYDIIIIDKHIMQKLNIFLSDLKFDAIGANNLKDELFISRFYNPEFDMNNWDFVKENDNWKMVHLPKMKNHNVQYNFEQDIINKLSQKEYYCHMDETGWRVHTPLTILPREYKKFVTFRGKELFSIDLKCSQIFLTLVLFNPDFWNPNSNMVNISTLKMQHLFENPKILKKINEAIANLGDDYEKFKEECCKGTIYEYMQDCYKEELNLDLSRNEVKIQFYMTMFTSNTFINTEQAKPKRLFRVIFPTVYEVFKAIKTQRKNEVLKLNDYDPHPIEKFSTLLPVMLQRLESYIFIKNIATHIIENYPYVRFYTIHDSINTTENSKSLITSIIESEIRRITGLTPTLKETSWSKEK